MLQSIPSAKQETGNNPNVSQFEMETTRECYHRSRILLHFCNSFARFICPTPWLYGVPAKWSASCETVWQLLYTVGLLLTSARSSSSTLFAIPPSTQFSFRISVETGVDLYFVLFDLASNSATIGVITLFPGPINFS